MLTTSGTTALPGLIFQVILGCQTHVRVKDTSREFKVNFIYVFSYLFVFSLHPISNIKTLSHLILIPYTFTLTWNK